MASATSSTWPAMDPSHPPQFVGFWNDPVYTITLPPEVASKSNAEKVDFLMQQATAIESNARKIFSEAKEYYTSIPRDKTPLEENFMILGGVIPDLGTYRDQMRRLWFALDGLGVECAEQKARAVAIRQEIENQCSCINEAFGFLQSATGSIYMAKVGGGGSQFTRLM